MHRPETLVLYVEAPGTPDAKIVLTDYHSGHLWAKMEEDNMAQRMPSPDPCMELDEVFAQVDDVTSPSPECTLAEQTFQYLLSSALDVSVPSFLASPDTSNPCVSWEPRVLNDAELEALIE